VVALVVRDGRNWVVREIPRAEIVKAVVQVEFSPPSQAELELAGMTGTERPAGTEAGA
jgi:ribosome maturation factor RimP